MQTKGRVISISKNLSTNKLLVTFEIETNPVDELNTLQGIDLDITAKKYRERRSLDANSYFHVLVSKIADKMNLSKTRAKNIMIGRYGQQDFMDDGTPVILKTNIQPEQMAEQEFLHCFPCRTSIEGGNEVIFYKVFRGSHTYNSKEMSILIEGTIQEAKELGIETIPPGELERMISAWQVKKA